MYKARNFKKDENVYYAVKVMDMTKMSKKLVEKFLPRELTALMDIKHENVVRVCDIFKMSKKIFVFMEYAGGGDLSGFVKKNKAVKEELACVWFTQVSNAVHYLHTEAHMAHRDIKLDNILLNEAGTAKLTDFGFAIFNDEEDENAVSETFCGTVSSFNLIALFQFL